MKALKVHQVWFETSIGPTFSTKEKAIRWLESDGEPYEEHPRDGYPRIVEISVDYTKGWFMDR
jgi:hypothetical protein